jgi:hypothetical protein
VADHEGEEDTITIEGAEIFPPGAVQTIVPSEVDNADPFHPLSVNFISVPSSISTRVTKANWSGVSVWYAMMAISPVESIIIVNVEPDVCGTEPSVL